LCVRHRSQHTVRFVVRLELALHDEDGRKAALAPFFMPLMFGAAVQPGKPTPLTHTASKPVKATLRGALHATIAAATQCRTECWSIHVHALTATAGPVGDGLGPLAKLLVLHADVAVRFSKRLHRCWADDDDLRRAADTYGAAVSQRQTRARPSPLSEELAAELQATGWPGLDVCAAYVSPVDLSALPTASAAAGDAAVQTRGASVLSCLQSAPVAQPVAPAWQPTAHKSRSAARTSRASQSRLPSTPMYTSTSENHTFSSAEDELAATIATAVQALVVGAVPYADVEHGGAPSADDNNLSDARALRILRTALQGVEEQPDEAPDLRLLPP
jgi:hypothetical protein